MLAVRSRADRLLPETIVVYRIFLLRQSGFDRKNVVVPYPAFRDKAFHFDLIVIADDGIQNRRSFCHCELRWTPTNLKMIEIPDFQFFRFGSVDKLDSIFENIERSYR